MTNKSEKHCLTKQVIQFRFVPLVYKLSLEALFSNIIYTNALTHNLKLLTINQGFDLQDFDNLLARLLVFKMVYSEVRPHES